MLGFVCPMHQVPPCVWVIPTPRARAAGRSPRCDRAGTMRSCHRSCHRALTWPWQVCLHSGCCPQAALPRDANGLMSAFAMSLLGVPRLAGLPGSRHSNSLFHFSGLSFWHSEKHHLKLIKAPYFVPNLTATSSVYYVLCRVGGTSLQGVLGWATKTHGWGGIYKRKKTLMAFPQITVFAQFTGLWWNPLVPLQGKAKFLARASCGDLFHYFLLLPTAS